MGLPVVVTPTRRRHRVTQPFRRFSDEPRGDSLRRSLSGPSWGEKKDLGAGYHTGLQWKKAGLATSRPAGQPEGPVAST